MPTPATTLSNSALAQKLDDVATGWRSFIGSLFAWLQTNQSDTVVLTDPYTGNTYTLTTPSALAHAYDNLVGPANSAITQINAKLDTVNQKLADASQAQSIFDSLKNSIIGYRDQASASASTASNSSTSASTSATTATNKAADASASATSASGSAATAAARANDAANSASAAESSAEDAASYADIAKNARARTWYTGTGAPTVPLPGNPILITGDLYLNRSTDDVYSFNATGSTWGSPIATLRGAQGPQGVQGPKGDTGSIANGADVVTGNATINGAFITTNLTGYIKGAGTGNATAVTKIPFTDIAGPLPASMLPAFTGDVTSTAGTSVLTIGTGSVVTAKLQDNAVTTVKIADANVTNSKLAQMAANTIKGNVTGSTGPAVDVTLANLAAAMGFQTMAYQSATGVSITGGTIGGSTTVNTSGSVAAGVVTASGGSAILYCYDRTSNRTWGWYGVGDVFNLYNGSGNVASFYPSGLLGIPALTMSSAPSLAMTQGPSGLTMMNLYGGTAVNTPFKDTQIAIGPTSGAKGRGSFISMAATFSSAWGGTDYGPRASGGIGYLASATNALPRSWRIALFCGGDLLSLPGSGDTPAEVFSASHDEGFKFINGVTQVAGIDTAGNFSGAGSSLTGVLSFGSTTRQLINLFSTQYAIGIQSGTPYIRTGVGFAIFKGGSHSDSMMDPGAGGTVLLKLDGNGLLTTPAGLCPGDWVNQGVTSSPNYQLASWVYVQLTSGFTITPVNVPFGTECWIRVRNSSGGSISISFNGSWTLPSGSNFVARFRRTGPTYLWIDVLAGSATDAAFT